MIEKLNYGWQGGGGYTEPTRECMCDKINELVDVINTIQKERGAERFEIQEWIGILEAVRKSVNVHERQIDKLQMMLEPHKCEPAENRESSKMEQDPYAEQREWIGKLCWFWCTNENYADLGILQAITPAYTPNIYLKKDSSIWYLNCEPVKPDDDIIYKGGNK